MGYLHIPNLYKDQSVLMFRECYAMEKIHGTSASISWGATGPGQIHFHPGGETIDRFKALFDIEQLTASFQAIGLARVTVFGEAYGGKQQGMSKRYGPTLKFVAFDVRVGGEDGDSGSWLSVPDTEVIARCLGLEFVHYVKIPTDLAAVDAERDAASVQAVRNGIVDPQPREGIVLRPLVEMRSNRERIIAKHKRPDERETKAPREVDAAALAVLTEANAIAEEWVTETRMGHVLDKLPQGLGMEATPDVVRAMMEDVLRESAGEIVDSKEARRAIGTRTAKMFKARVQALTPPKS